VISIVINCTTCRILFWFYSGHRDSATCNTHPLASPSTCFLLPQPTNVSIRQHTSAHVSMRQHSVFYYFLSIAAADLPTGALYHRVHAQRLNRHRYPVSIREHTSAYVSIYQHTPEYVSIYQHTSAYVAYVSIRQHTLAHVSIRQHTSAYVSTRQHTSAYVSTRQHTSAYVHAQLLSRHRCPFLEHKDIHTTLGMYHRYVSVCVCCRVCVYFVHKHIHVKARKAFICTHTHAHALTHTTTYIAKTRRRYIYLSTEEIDNLTFNFD
jgi:hypothetical protein